MQKAFQLLDKPQSLGPVEAWRMYHDSYPSPIPNEVALTTTGPMPAVTYSMAMLTEGATR